jgi:hypothetical protein
VTIDGRAWGLTHSHKIGIVLEKLVLAPTNILAALPEAFDNPVALRVINDTH